ncbi:PmoA family protein [Paractinoplanes maris]|uniref:DUF6807 domain-containing protein n=1 Tax=Paractinoplanes maris TaxID=1734446 RepID=UPI0020203668|nr:PmoA family protein [Actinoplanes maris]
MTSLRVGGVDVATYVVDPPLDIRLAPRPYLHPVRTLGGTVVTDELCFDHPWHLGASVTLADVNGWNFWGGRTFVRDQGYTWLPDHGTVRHDRWEGDTEVLRWCDGQERTVLTERRLLSAAAAPGGWELSFRYALTAPPDQPVTIGSPATNGRTGGAGYGGFFWRCPSAAGAVASPAGQVVASPAGQAVASPGGQAVASPGGRAVASEENGSSAESLTLTVDDRYTLVFRGLAGDDRWFTRTDDYIGVCAALAYEKPLLIPPGDTLSRHIRVLVLDQT